MITKIYVFFGITRLLGSKKQIISLARTTVIIFSFHACYAIGAAGKATASMLPDNFSQERAENAIAEVLAKTGHTNQNIITSFNEICRFIAENPASLAWRSTNKPSVYNEHGLKLLAKKYVKGYFRSNFPSAPGRVPDHMVSIVMQEAYGYTESESEQIKLEHQYSMSAESCVGALLERYLDSKLKNSGWIWCCGEFIRGVDFIYCKKDGEWYALQIKNRDNSENSSSKSIRNNTEIQKWFRTFSKTGKTNWDNLPALMQNHNLSEAGFIAFVKNYLAKEKCDFNIQ